MNTDHRGLPVFIHGCAPRAGATDRGHARWRRAHNAGKEQMVFYLTFWEIIGFVLIAILVIMTIFAIIEPGPLQRRSRNPRGQGTNADPTVENDPH
jgi:hypothetical protein